MTGVFPVFLVPVTAPRRIKAAFPSVPRVTLFSRSRAGEQEQQLDNEKRNVQIFLAATIVMTVFTALLVLILIAMRNRIRLAITIFEEAARALTSMPTVRARRIMQYPLCMSAHSLTLTRAHTSCRIRWPCWWGLALHAPLPHYCD